MSEDKAKSQRLKNFVRERIREALLKTGRQLVAEKGADFLTARKLSEASNTSVGTIYNTFATMDEFAAAVNMQTLDELYAAVTMIIPETNPYVTINRYADVFSAFVANNRHLWMLLYRAHLFNAAEPLSTGYRRRICRFEKLLERQAVMMFGRLSRAERKIALQTLGLSVFAVSGFLAADASDQVRKVSKSNLCKLLLNTYLAGLESLGKAGR